jgi:hypothetical protein
MTHRPSLAEAADRHDITLAMTPTQVVLLALGVFLLLRILRGLRR